MVTEWFSGNQVDEHLGWSNLVCPIWMPRVLCQTQVFGLGPMHMLPILPGTVSQGIHCLCCLEPANVTEMQRMRGHSIPCWLLQ